MSSRGCGIVGRFGEAYPYTPGVLPIVAVDPEVLFVCLHYLLAVSVCLRAVGSGVAQVDIDYLIYLLQELWGELQTTIRSYVLSNICTLQMLLM